MKKHYSPIFLKQPSIRIIFRLFNGIISIILAFIGGYFLLAFFFGIFPCQTHLYECPEGLEALRWIQLAAIISIPGGLLIENRLAKFLLLY